MMLCFFIYILIFVLFIWNIKDVWKKAFGFLASQMISLKSSFQSSQSFHLQGSK